MNDYGNRDVLDKLGIKPSLAVAFVEAPVIIDAELRRRIEERVGRGPAGENEAVNIVVASIDSSTDVASLLQNWKARIAPNGGIWLLAPKRGLPGYVNQSDLITMGLAAGLVDNKSCSVSDIASGLRFVIRLAERPSSTR